MSQSIFRWCSRAGDHSRLCEGWKNQTGAWDHVGASRNPILSDGTTASETLTEYTVGHSFAYEVTGFTNILGRLVEGVRGEWTFTPDGEGTVIRWTYEFKPRRGRFISSCAADSLRSGAARCGPASRPLHEQ